MVVRSLYFGAEFLGQSTIGYLGWLNLPLPLWVYLLVGIAFPLGVYADLRTARPAVATAAWLALIVFAAISLVELALYVIWTPVGGYSAEGVQGRYFIPALPMLGFAGTALLAGRIPVSYSDHAYLAVVATLGAATVAMHCALITGYGVFH